MDVGNLIIFDLVSFFFGSDPIDLKIDVFLEKFVYRFLGKSVFEKIFGYWVCYFYCGKSDEIQFHIVWLLMCRLLSDCLSLDCDCYFVLL